MSEPETQRKDPEDGDVPRCPSVGIDLARLAPDESWSSPSSTGSEDRIDFDDVLQTSVTAPAPDVDIPVPSAPIGGPWTLVPNPRAHWVGILAAAAIGLAIGFGLGRLDAAQRPPTPVHVHLPR